MNEFDNEIPIDYDSLDFSQFELEDELERSSVSIDVDKLAKSNIKSIIVRLPDFLELNCLDCNNNSLTFKALCDFLSEENQAKAKKLNEIYKTHIWNLLDEKVKENMDFDEFVS